MRKLEHSGLLTCRWARTTRRRRRRDCAGRTSSRACRPDSSHTPPGSCASNETTQGAMNTTSQTRLHCCNTARHRHEHTSAQLTRSIDTSEELTRSIDTSEELTRSIDTSEQLTRSIDTCTADQVNRYL